MAVLIIAVAAGSAVAEESGEDQALLPSSTDVIEAISEGSEFGSEELTDPGAAAGVPLEDLDREQALLLLSGVFGEVVEAPVGIYDELQGAKILTPNVAVIPGDEAPGQSEDNSGDEIADDDASDLAPGPPPSSPAELSAASLIHSTVPLQVEDGAGAPAPLDLTLDQAQGALEPVEPLVDIRIPEQLGDGIEIPGVGVGIQLVGAPGERSATVTEDNIAFYPNVADQADFAVAPTPSGVETFSQLRTPESPTTQTYKLTLPTGATVAPAEAGGAEVLKGEE